MTAGTPRQNSKQRPKIPKGSPYSIRQGRGGRFHRLIVKETGNLARDHLGEPIDEGGYGMLQQAEAKLEELARRPGATWLALDAAPGHPERPATPRTCEFVLCRERARLHCIGRGFTGVYCPMHAEARGFRIPEKTR